MAGICVHACAVIVAGGKLDRRSSHSRVAIFGDKRCDDRAGVVNQLDGRELAVCDIGAAIGLKAELQRAELPKQVSGKRE